MHWFNPISKDEIGKKKLIKKKYKNLSLIGLNRQTHDLCYKSEKI
jgi:hypothetical protein